MLRTFFKNSSKNLANFPRMFSNYYAKEIHLRIIPDNLITKDKKEVDLKADLLVKFVETDSFDDPTKIKETVNKLTDDIIKSNISKTHSDKLDRKNVQEDTVLNIQEIVNSWTGDIVKFQITNLKLI